MARGKRLVIRFTLNRGAKDFEREFDSTASKSFTSIVIKDVAVTYVDTYEKTIKNRIQRQVKQAVLDEIQMMATLYRRFIVGAAERRTKPSGTLRTAYPGGPTQELDIPDWIPRSVKYLNAKKAEGYTGQWFLRTGALGTFVKDPKKWMLAFGGVRVNVTFSRRGPASNIRDFTGNRLSLGIQQTNINRFAIARIRVGFFGKVTALGIEEDIIGALYSRYPNIAFKVAGRRSRYRPTFEPFLQYAMQRSVPFAVNRRIQDGLRE